MATFGRFGTGRTTAVVLALLGVLLWAGGGPSLASYTAASVQNTSNAAANAGMAITHTYNSTTCVTTPRMTTAACGGTLGTTASPAASRTDSITNNGTTAVTQTVTAASCAVVQFANAKSATDPLLPRNTVTFQQTDKWGSTSAAGFSGSAYATDPVGTGGTGVLGLLQGSFSIGLWFKASDTQGGGLMSLSGSLSNGSGSANPVVWLDQSGNVHAFVSTTLAGTQIASSGTNYGDGAWHFVVLAVTTPLITTTLTLYVDGVSKASSGGLSLLTGISGRWHVGWSNFSGLTQPTSAYFHGSISGAFVNSSTALSGSQISTLNSSASASAYQTTLNGQSGISSIWMLGDTGFSTVSGTSLPAGNIFDPCSKVNVAWTFTTPSGSIAVQSLTALADNAARSVTAPSVGGTQSLSIATAQGTGYNSDLAGLHLYVPLTFTYGVSGATNWIQTLTWSDDPTDVFWA